MSGGINSVKVLILVSILLITNFALFDPGSEGRSRVDYQTENKDWIWTMDDLANNATGTVNKTGSVFIFLGNVTVLQKDTLVVGPGEILKFTNNTALIILGNMQAIGTPADPIIFTSNSSTEWDWNGLHFEGSGEINRQKNSLLDHCIVENATTGLTIFNSSLTIQNSIIQNNIGLNLEIFNSPCIINNNRIWNSSNIGIRAYQTMSVISNNTFEELTDGIVVTDSMDLEIKGNLFTALENGIIISPGSELDVIGNTFEHYNGVGIEIDTNETTVSDNYFQFIRTAIISSDQQSLVIDANVIENVTDAIVLNKVSSSEIVNNVINYTSNVGLELLSCEGLKINGNKIFNHFGNGLNLSDNDDISITKNIIYFGHGTSINLLDSTNVDVIDNSIYFSFHKGLSINGIKPVSFHSNLINDSVTYDLEILGEMDLTSLNNTFSYSRLFLDTNVKLTVNNYFSVYVYDRNNLPMQNVLIEIYLNEKKALQAYTGENGSVENILLTFREYDGLKKFTQDQIILTAILGSLEFDYSPFEIDISKTTEFVLKANYVPTIKIHLPEENTTVSGIVIINGTAFDPDNEIQKIQVQVGRGPWETVIPANDDWTIWYYALDTTKFTDGLYTLNFSASDGFSTGMNSLRVFFLNGEVGETKLGITIDTPLESEAVWETIMVFGKTTSGDFRVKNVLVQVDNQPWTNATPISETETPARSPEQSRELIKDWTVWSIFLNTRLLTNGEHIVRAIVTDGFDVSVDEKTIFVTNLPENISVELHADFEAPLNEDVVNGTINVTGIVWGCPDPIEDFKLRIDGLAVTNTFNVIGPNWWMWNYWWDTTRESNGLHQIQVWARNTTISVINEIYVKVQNVINDDNKTPELSILITSPMEGSKINKTTLIQGITYSVDEVIDVQIKIDEGDYVVVNNLDTNWESWNYEWNVNLHPDGIRSATATVRTMNQSASHTIWLILDKPMDDSGLEIVITHPNNGSIVNGTVLVRGIAWYSGRSIYSVDVQFGPYLWDSAEPLRDDWSIWFYEWNTSELKNGMYTLQCRVYDGVDSIKTSIEIEISNLDEKDPGNGDKPPDDNGNQIDDVNEEKDDNKELEEFILRLVLINLAIMIILLITILYIKNREGSLRLSGSNKDGSVFDSEDDQLSSEEE